MSRQQNIATQERFGAEVIVKGDLDVIDELCAPSFVDHDPAPDQGPGPEGLKHFWAAFRSAFPDLEVEVDHMVADDDTLALAYRARGTHEGEFMGLAPTGRRIEARGLQMARFEDGRYVERWGMSDQLAMLAQIGAPPG